MLLTRTTLKLLSKSYQTRDEFDQKNAFDTATLLFTRCNYFSTLEGLVLTHNYRTYIRKNDGRGFGKIVSSFLLIIEFFINTSDDILVLYFAFYSLYENPNIYEIGLVFGKISKMLV